MSVFRVEKNREFTVIANCVFKDKTLSAKAKGILVEMLSLPKNWDYTLKGLTTLFSDGIDSIRQGIRELEEHGYIVRERRRDEKGRLGSMEYIIYETPHTAVEKSENPVEKSNESVGNSVSESPSVAPVCSSPVLESPVWENPILDKPAEEEPMTYKELKNKELNISITNQSIYQVETEPALMDVMGYDEARERVEDNIQYDILCEQYPQERLEEIVDIAAEALCTRRSAFRLGQDVYPYALVRERLLRLNASHIGYIFTCINGNTTEIRNIKQYLLKTLINAPATMETYYTAKVNHDLYGMSASGSVFR